MNPVPPILAGFLFAGAVVPARAAVPVEGKGKVDRAVDRTKRNLINEDIEYQKVLKSLYRIARQTQKIVAQKAAIERERLGVEQQIRRLAEEIRNVEQRVKTQKGMLLTKLAFLHRFKGEAWLQFLFQARNSAGLERSMKVLGLIGERDLALLRDYNDGVQTFNRDKGKFVVRLNQLNELGKEIEKKEVDLLRQYEARTKLLADIRSSQLSMVKLLRKLERNKKNLAESGILDSLSGASFFERKGELPEPVHGLVLRGFGLERDAETSVFLRHSGWFYAKESRVSVRAIFDARVAANHFIPEYGQTIILDHGDHFYSVYSNLSRGMVVEGDSIKEGTVIGFTGESPFDGRRGLYFEIRHFSESMDPKSWMKGRRYEV
ncbi:MAG: hypothetical protein C5B49_00855, partial [Bdellovibrio sp.]